MTAWKWRLEHAWSDPSPRYFGTALAAWTCGSNILIAAQPTHRIDRTNMNDVGLTHWNTLRVRTSGDPYITACNLVLMSPPTGIPSSIDRRYAQELLESAKPATGRSVYGVSGSQFEDAYYRDLWPADGIEARIVGFMQFQTTRPATMPRDVAADVVHDEDWRYTLDAYLHDAKSQQYKRVMTLPLDKVADNTPDIEPLRDLTARWESKCGMVNPDLARACLGGWTEHIWQSLNIMSRLFKTDGNAHMFAGHRKNAASIAVVHQQQRTSHQASLYRRAPPHKQPKANGELAVVPRAA